MDHGWYGYGFSSDMMSWRYMEFLVDFLLTVSLSGELSGRSKTYIELLYITSICGSLVWNNHHFSPSNMK